MPRGDPSFEFVDNTWTGTQQASRTSVHIGNKFQPWKQMPPSIATVVCFYRPSSPTERQARRMEGRCGGTNPTPISIHFGEKNCHLRSLNLMEPVSLYGYSSRGDVSTRPYVPAGCARLGLSMQDHTSITHHSIQRDNQGTMRHYLLGVTPFRSPSRALT